MSGEERPKKHKCPPQYRAPLKKRAEIVAYLMNRRGHSDNYDYLHFAFNVKVHSPDLSLRNLYRLWQEYNGREDDVAQRPGYRLELRRLHAAIKEDILWQWGVNDARNKINEDDTYKDLWDGTPVGATWEAQGRCSGWLCLNHTDLFTISSNTHTGVYQEVFEELPYRDLHTFYRFIVQCEADFTEEKAKAEVEHQAAFNFFANHVEHEIDPFRSAWLTSWETDTVFGMTKATIYHRDWARCPELADALEDAGCQEPTTLAALRAVEPRSKVAACKALLWICRRMRKDGARYVRENALTGARWLGPFGKWVKFSKAMPFDNQDDAFVFGKMYLKDEAFGLFPYDPEATDTP